MANIKTGLAYYTVDTDRYMDIRIKRLKKALGCDGIAVYDYLLCEIYRDKGYFFEWNDNSVFDVAEYFGLKETKVKGIVEFCASVGLFSKVLLGSGVLTSKSIQQRYVTMCNRAKRKETSIREDLLLIKLTEECPKLTEECPKLTEVCDKEKKSKEYHTQIGACAHETKCPYIQKLSKNQAWLDVICMQHQIQIEDALRWLERFDLDVQCSGTIHINMSDAQSHFNAWLKKELKNQNKTTNGNKTGRRVIAPGEVKDYGSSF